MNWFQKRKLSKHRVVIKVFMKENKWTIKILKRIFRKIEMETSTILVILLRVVMKLMLFKQNSSMPKIIIFRPKTKKII